MRALGWLRWFAVMGAASVLATSCSADAGGGAKRATLGSVLGIDGGLGTDFNDLRAQGQELTAACMIEAGWEYIPVQYPDLDVMPVSSDADGVERIKREGLGYAYAPLYNGTDASAGYDPWAGFVDPNAAYVASLSEDERAAYDVSLYGTEEEQAQTKVTYTEFDPTTGSEFGITESQSGCQGASDAKVFAPASGQTADDAAAIRQFWEELQERVKADPRSVALDERWASCMRNSGYDYEGVDAFRAATYSEFSAKVGEVTGGAVATDPTAGWTQEQIDDFFATATEDEVDALFNTTPDLTADQRSKLEAILVEEVAVALADHECTAGLEKESADIYADVEEQYALAQEGELTALAASLAADG
ncbi:MAG: hypothetical protein HGA51_02380 [Demequinaceae bacterium]|nr:hypothetical protein [Demequinaceae bacterium]